MDLFWPARGVKGGVYKSVVHARTLNGIPEDYTTEN